MSAVLYFKEAQESLKRVADSQGVVIGQAASLIVEAILADRSLFSFGATHSFILTEELVYRTGGLILINPIYPHGMNLSVRPMTQTSRFERIPGPGTELLAGSAAAKGDVLILASTSGRNAAVIDMAPAARQLGIHTIGITAQAYTQAVSSRHPSGHKLADLCEVVVDNCAPYGDAAVEIRGFPQKVGPLSTLTGVAIVNAIVTETVARLVEAGVVPPVFISANVDGCDAHNEAQLKANAHRIHYMD